MPVDRGEAEIDVETAARLGRERLAQERQPQPELVGGLARHLLEQEDPIDALERLAVLQRQLPLRVVELGVDRLDGEPTGLCATHDLGDHTERIGHHAGAVHHRRRRVVLPPSAFTVGLEQVGLELDADPRVIPEVVPIGDRLAQRMSRRSDVRLSSEVDIGDDDTGAGFPAGPHVGEVIAGVDVGQAGGIDADVDIEDVALVIEQIRADAEGRATVGDPPWQVLPASQPEMVGPQHAEPVVAGHDAPSDEASSGINRPSTTTRRPSRATVQPRIGRSK